MNTHILPQTRPISARPTEISGRPTEISDRDTPTGNTDPRAGDVPTGGAVTISPFYHSAVNEVTQPDRYLACSHYVTRRWKRELGPNGFAILTSFRDRCFFNRKTGEKRDVIQVPIPEIAAECGLSEKTVRREIAGNKALQRFLRAQREPAPDPNRGGWRWRPNTFQVAMDDPIHPDDEPALVEIVRRKARDAEKAPEDPLARARRLAASHPPAPQTTPHGRPAPTLGQIDRTQNPPPRQRSDNLTERSDGPAQRSVNLSQRPVRLSTTLGQSVPTFGQIDRTLKSPDSSLLKKTLMTPAAPGDSLSLFGEEAQDKAGDKSEAPNGPGSRRPTLGEIQAEWDALPPEGRERFRPEALRQLGQAGHPSPKPAQVGPTLFKLFWAERKGLAPAGLAAGRVEQPGQPRRGAGTD